MVLAALISMGGMNAFAADEPTVSDAHEFIRNVINEGNIRGWGPIIHWSNYSGKDCHSSIVMLRDPHPTLGKRYPSVDIEWDWSTANFATEPSSYYIRIAGEFSADTQGDDQIDRSGIALVFQNSVTTHRFTNAAKLLMNACKKKSKFD